MKKIITKIKDILSSKCLLLVTVNKDKYNQQIEGSCTIKINPSLKLTREERTRLRHHVNAAVEILRSGIEDINKI